MRFTTVSTSGEPSFSRVVISFSQACRTASTRRPVDVLLSLQEFFTALLEVQAGAIPTDIQVETVERVRQVAGYLTLHQVVRMAEILRVGIQDVRRRLASDATTTLQLVLTSLLAVTLKQDSRPTERTMREVVQHLGLEGTRAVSLASEVRRYFSGQTVQIVDNETQPALPEVQ